MLRAGERIADRFEIVAPAGSGGMSQVYRAHDRHAGTPVALKLLGEGNDPAASRFHREARVLAELGHPAIVSYIAHGTLASGTRWLAMEWLDGEDLGRRLARGPLGVSDTLNLARRVAAALAVTHARGVVHRDIKPQNLMLVGGRVEGVKLIDFGVARLGPRAEVTQSGDRVGTPRYMAPEQIKGWLDIDTRADVFALGGVLYACLAGRPPFDGESQATLVQQILHLPPPALAGVPPAVTALVGRMLSKAREDRPSDGAAVVEQLVKLPELDDTRLTGLEPTLGGGERRVVTIIVTPAPRDELVAVVARSGAGVESTTGGSSTVTLGGHGVATDRAAHAARLALAIHAHLPGVPVGLATGWAYVGATAPIGEAMDRASALARSAATGVWIDEVTAGLLDNRFQLAGSAARLELLGERRGDPARKLLGRTTPFVGRERELLTLDAAFAGCVDGQATAVLVTGAAGAGKSRLRYELMARIGERAQVFLGRGDALRAGSPFGLLAPALRESAGIHDDDARDDARRKLRARVARVVPPADAARVSDFLGELTSLPFPDGENVQLRAARGDRALMADQVAHAWEDFLRAQCALGPVVLILDDLHWGDVPSVQLCDRVLRNLADHPLLVLALARPEVHDLFPRLWEAHGVTEIALPPLPRKAGERLVAQVLGERATPAVVAAIVERAGGNAFFLEELIRSVAESSGALPHTLVAMVLARVEALPAEARRVLRAASVFGDAFWQGGVAALGAGDAGEWLPLLAERELVGRRASQTLMTEEEYVFRHALVREAAYGTLTDADRRTAHRAAGLWLEQNGGRDPVVLAQHFERGGEPARALGHYLRAAEQALEASDLEAALRRVASGITCGAMGAELGRLRLVEAQARAWRTEFAAAIDAAQQAARCFEAGSPPWLAAVAEGAIACARLGRVDEAFALADELRARAAPGPAAYRALARVAAMLALVGGGDRVSRLLDATPAPESCSDPQLAGFLYRAGGSMRRGNEHPGAIPGLERAVGCFLRAGDLRSATFDRANLGIALMRAGAWDRAETLTREVLAVATRLGLTMVEADARFVLAEVHAGRGDAAEAEALFADVIGRYVKNGARRMEAAARCGLARHLARAGRVDEAEAEARQAVSASSTMPPAQAYALATLAHLRGAEAAAAAWEAFGKTGAAEEEVWTLTVVARALAGVDDAAAAAATAAARERAASWLEGLDGELRASLAAREEHVWLASS